MTSILSTFANLGRAALLASVLGGGALVAAPAIAQNGPPTGFSLNVPDNGGSQQMAPQSGAPQAGAPAPSEAQGTYDPETDDFIYCLDNDEIEDALYDYGFTRVRITREFRNNRVEATATWGRNQYSMRVDRCSGAVDRVRLLRRGNIGLQFNFGN